jgi:hypothetical protein
MQASTCHTCDYDQHCDDIQRTVAHLEQEKDMLQISQQFAEDNIPELVILENLPKITPASAKRETGAKVGTRGDININLVNKRGVTVEKAAEIIFEKYGPDGERLLPPEFDEYRIRTEIIDILKMGVRNYRAQFLTPIDELQADIEEKQEQYKAECVGDLPNIDLTEYQHAKALAIAMAIKYKYAA